MNRLILISKNGSRVSKCKIHFFATLLEVQLCIISSAKPAWFVPKVKSSFYTHFPINNAVLLATLFGLNIRESHASRYEKCCRHHYKEKRTMGQTTSGNSSTVNHLTLLEPHTFQKMRVES